MDEKTLELKAIKATQLIISDISDRRGLRQEWERVDLPTQWEIHNAFVKIIVKCYTEQLPNK